MGVVVYRRTEYGPVEMSKAAYTGNYTLLFNTSYWDSKVGIQIVSSSTNDNDDELASVDPSGTNLALPGNCSYDRAFAALSHLVGQADISILLRSQIRTLIQTSPVNTS